MKLEETLYLELHPEIQAINAKKANTYLYVAKKEDFKRFPSAFILGTHMNPDTSDLQVSEKAGDYHTFRAGLGLKSDEVAFESARPLNKGSTVKLPVYMALTSEDQVAFVNMLGKLKLEVENTGPVMEGHAPSKMTYCGISAIDTVAKLKQQDLEAARTVRENGFIDRKTVEQKHLTLSYDKEKLADIVFEEGCSRLTGDALGLKKAAEASEELQAVLECAIKMKAALQDFMADTKEKVMAGMVKLMEDAGLRAVKITNIARTNPDFKPELLPERNSKPVGHQMTMEEQADKAAVDAKRREQKNLIKAAAKAAQSKRISPKESLLQNVEKAKSQIKQRELIK